MKRLLLLSLVLLITACGTSEASTPAPTPEAISLYYPPTLQVWADKLANCAASNPLIALYFFQTTDLSPEIGSGEIGLELGQTMDVQPAAYLSQVGWEQIVVIINKDNQISQLSKDELVKIYSGTTLDHEINSREFFQVWLLPESDPTRIIFDKAVLQTKPVNSEAILAPDPAAMLEAISEGENSIGYIPQSFIHDADPAIISQIKTIHLDPTLEEGLRQPVLAITRGEPSGYRHDLLVCLQNTGLQ